MEPSKDALKVFLIYLAAAGILSLGAILAKVL